MRLQSLEIQGFKSFPDKTKIVFNQGLTAVVGPNGSGKSNIADAMRFVMGEQSSKSLRGSKMEDVVFAGTKTRPGQGFTMVSLTIENHDRALMMDADEVVISRRYDRVGESEYKINHKTARLKDVSELLMDTGLGKDGYAMVGQGRISEIVQSKSEARREIFEEAAGIAKVRYRRCEAERKLSMAQDNLVRLQDILGELEGRVKPLEEQAKKAKLFLTLAESQKQLEIALWVDRLKSYHRTMKDQSDVQLVEQQRLLEIEQLALASEQQAQSLQSQMELCLSNIDSQRRIQEELQSKIAAMQAEIAVCENDIAHHGASQETILRQIAQQQAKQQDVERAVVLQKEQIQQQELLLENSSVQLTQTKTTLLELTTKAEQFSTEQQKLQNMLSQWILLKSECQIAVAVTQQKLSSCQQQQDQTTKQLGQASGAIEASRQELAKMATRVTLLQQQEQSTQNMLRGYEMKQSAKRQELETHSKAAHELTLAYQGYMQKAELLQQLENNLEGFSHAVKQIIKASKQKRLDGIVGTVASLISVEDAYSTAIEIALGGALSHIVVEQEHDAKKAIAMLKQANAGRATFLPIRSIAGRKEQAAVLQDCTGFVALASDLVRYESRYQAIVLFLLGRIVIAENLDAAITLAKMEKHRLKIVTLDGQIINPGGSMTGGSVTGKTAGILHRRQEIETLTQQANTAKNQLAKRRQQQQDAQATLQRIQAEQTALESQRKTLQEESLQATADVQRVGQWIAQKEAEQRNLQSALQQLACQLAQTQALHRQQIDEQQTSQQQILEVSQSIEKLQGSGGALDTKREQLLTKINQIKLEQMAKQKDLEHEYEKQQQLSRQSTFSKQDSSELIEQQKALAIAISQKQQQLKNTSEQITQTNAQIQQIKQSIEQQWVERNHLEQQVTVARQQQKAFADQKQSKLTAIARLEEQRLSKQSEYDHLERQLWESYEINRHEAEMIAVCVVDVTAQQQQLAKTKEDIKALGSINVAAIEEHRVVSERYDYLSTQLTDVVSSRDGLLDLIAQLTCKMQELFLKKFSEINHHFSRIFIALFGGGQARLQLTTPQNVLESGIEILVEPPGKVIKTLSLLSGGEQTFVAIAIYFAILKVRPAPFCVLDEIEAALDDVNVSRFGAYLRTLCHDTQFIAITHRRGTMEAADVLYGVTMQEEGVSKLLKLEHHINK